MDENPSGKFAVNALAFALIHACDIFFGNFLLFSKIPLAILEIMVYTNLAPAGVMELVDVVDSKSTDGDIVPVRVRPPAPK